MKAEVAIVAHPLRERHAERLADRVRAEAIVMDNRSHGCEKNHTAAWTWLAGSNCDWGVVLEDDAIPVDDFRKQLYSVLEASPTPIVSLYLGQCRPPHWQPSIAQVINTDTSFIVSDTLLSCVGLCIRKDLIDDAISYLLHGIEARPELPVDELLTEWVKSIHENVSYAVPSIIDHLDTKTVMAYHKSQYFEEDMTSRTERRVAWRFGTRNSWDQQYVTLPPPGILWSTPV